MSLNGPYGIPVFVGHTWSYVAISCDSNTFLCVIQGKEEVVNVEDNLPLHFKYICLLCFWIIYKTRNSST